MKFLALHKEKLIWLAVCLLAVFIIYGRTLAGDFVFDDRGIVDHQMILSDLNKFDQVLTMPYLTAVEGGAYRPTVVASYAFNYILLGSAPWGFHLINLLLYAASIFLLALVLKRLLKNKPLAYLTAALFLVLPIHTEAVANIVGRAEILSLLFSLLVFRELLKKEVVWWRAGIWLALALGSKETAVATAPIAVLIIYLKEKEIFSRLVLQKYAKTILAMFLGGAVYFGLRFLVLGQYFLKSATSIVENPLQFVSAKERIFTALSVLTMYLEKSFWPFNLCSDYSYNQLPMIKSFFHPATLIGALVIIFFSLAIFMFLKRAPVLALASAIFIFSYLPIANLVFPTGTIAGERLMYYPSLGLCLFAVWLILSLYRWSPKKILVYFYLAFFTAVFVFYGFLSFMRSGDWLTEKRLFTSAAKCAPGSVLSQSNLGAAYYLEKDLVNAKIALLRAEQIYDGYPKGINNLGLVYWKEGDRELARKYFLHALDFEFPYYGAYENLALMAIEDKNWVEAKKWLLELYSGNQTAADSYLAPYQGR